MTAEDRRFSPEGSDPRLRGPAAGAPGGILAALAGAVIFVAAFMFSLVVVAALAAVAVAAGAYLWWKTRALRRQMREHPPGGRLIDGEVIRDAHPPDPTER